MIHALDPVFIVEKVAHCPFYKVLTVDEALENTITKYRGLGGYEILGKSRRGGPIVNEESAEATDNNTERKTEKRDISQMTSEEIQRELALPLFKDSNYEFRNKMQDYFNRTKSQLKNQ